MCVENVWMGGVIDQYNMVVSPEAMSFVKMHWVAKKTRRRRSCWMIAIAALLELHFKWTRPSLAQYSLQRLLLRRFISSMGRNRAIRILVNGTVLILKRSRNRNHNHPVWIYPYSSNFSILPSAKFIDASLPHRLKNLENESTSVFVK